MEEHNTVESYVKDWMYGHELAYSSDKHKGYPFNKHDRSSYKVHALLEDEFLRGFIECCLMRTYFKRKKSINNMLFNLYKIIISHTLLLHIRLVRYNMRVNWE